LLYILPFPGSGSPIFSIGRSFGILEPWWVHFGNAKVLRKDGNMNESLSSECMKIFPLKSDLRMLSTAARYDVKNLSSLSPKIILGAGKSVRKRMAKNKIG